ncbi:hypothetical protein [Pseudonocardia spinosispora]|uniref:hypothetical protein n=1 Tax=Pseudonocardia spinosispora TaxID=103441 RepID=UPI0012EBEA6D|nr:hypothetical protein [Pseudonocardia spinosispora]
MSEPLAEPTQMSMFDLVRRGYDRRQVDDHMQTLSAQLAEVQQAHQREHRRADWAEGELRNARSQLEQQSAQLAESQNSGGPQGFGYRVEKLMRTAEQEAAEVRTSAAREATALLERARADAEAHRHEVEQSLITRTAMLDQEAAQRKVELDERERQIGEQAAASRQEAERMHADVKRQAEQVRQEAQARAEQERVKVEKAIRERQAAAEQELTRLRSLHDEVRGQLARLLESLAGEFSTSPIPYQAQARQQSHQQQSQQRAHSQQHAQQHPQPYPRQSLAQHRSTEQSIPMGQIDTHEDRPEPQTAN